MSWIDFLDKVAGGYLTPCGMAIHFTTLKTLCRFPNDTCILLESDFQACISNAFPDKADDSSSSSSARPSRLPLNRNPFARRLCRCFLRCARAHRGQHVCNLGDLRHRLHSKRLPAKECIEELTSELNLLATPPAGVADVHLNESVNDATDHAEFRVPGLIHFLGEFSEARRELLNIVSKRRFVPS